jgi:hypothetical protein
MKPSVKKSKMKVSQRRLVLLGGTHVEKWGKMGKKFMGNLGQTIGMAFSPFFPMN